jgi:O-6-methylguanine DNA methyltransferase
MSDHSRGPVVAATLATPWGPCRAAATPRGVVAVELLVPDDVFDTQLERRIGVRPGRPGERGRDPDGLAAASAHLLAAATRLAGYLDGERRGFDDVAVDWAGCRPWDRLVLGAVRLIPYGRTRSYGEVAAAIGRPGAARAVGGAVGRNPVAFVVPCHRVIAAGQRLGGYGGDWWGSRETLLEIKRDLLHREGVSVR